MSTHFRKYLSMVLMMALSGGVLAGEVTGAGASAPRQVYQSWSDAYAMSSGDIIHYQSIGSGGGVREVNAGSVDFGSTDIPLSPMELSEKNLVQFPILVTAAVPFVNIPGIPHGSLKLTGSILSDIYRGRVTQWNDPRIKELNGDIDLPDVSIIVVRREDSSAATLLLTEYFSRVNDDWKRTLGAGTMVQWSTGLGGKGDAGVHKFVERLPGAIGYVDYGYAMAHHLNFINLSNRSGNFVAPTQKSLTAAADVSFRDPDYRSPLAEDSAPESWPVTGGNFVLMRRKTPKLQEASVVLKFFEWAYTNGEKQALENGYVPLPTTAASALSVARRTISDGEGNNIP